MALLLCGLLAALGCGREERVARVNGESVTQEEFDAYLELRNLPKDDTRQRRAALEEYVEREALAQVIEEQGLLDPVAVAVEIDEFRKEMLISRYFDRYLRDQVTDQAVQNYYNAHPELYQERRVHAAHILIRTRRDMDESERQVRLTTAQDVYSKLQAGADFAEIAAEYSEDKVSGKKGGDLGWLKEGAISAVFSKKVFELEPGTISEPFETPFGFHVVKVLEAPREIKKSFEAVRGDIRHQLRSQARQAELERLLESAKVEIADDASPPAASEGAQHIANGPSGAEPR